MSGLTRKPSQAKSDLIGSLTSLVQPVHGNSGLEVMGSPTLAALQSISQTVSPEVVSVMVNAATLAENVEDLVQRFIGNGINIDALLKNPQSVLFEIVTNVGQFGGAIGDVREIIGSVINIIGDFRPALAQFVEYDQETRTKAYDLFRKELDLDNNVTEEVLEKYIVVGFQILAYGDDFVRILLPQILRLFNRNK